MPFEVRTDLAVEARDLWRESAASTDALPGVDAAEELHGSFRVTRVKILDEAGEQALCKPKGVYVTVGLEGLVRREENAFEDAARLLSDELRSALALAPDDTVLVAGLGNRAITPDAIGPECVSSVMVTRHLKQQMPQEFAAFRGVSAIETGVLGTTGVESAEMISSVARAIAPTKMIAVDALAARGMDKLCRTVQISDTGIVPGSGVGNHRSALDRETMGIPVIAVGVPTVVDAATMARDVSGGAISGDLGEAEQMMVTPRDIDRSVGDVSKLIGYAINLALHDGLTLADIDMFLS